jgi:hypothetical protein
MLLERRLDSLGYVTVRLPTRILRRMGRLLGKQLRGVAF